MDIIQAQARINFTQ